MANTDHAERLQRSVEEWNKWRGTHKGIQPDLNNAKLSMAKLSGADLRGADLRGADLCYADLSVANLRNADLTNADLSAAEIRDADLSDATLWGADLRDANLNGTTLWRADLRDVDLRNSDLTNAYLSGAKLSTANLHNADLSGARLRSATLWDVDLIHARLRSATLWDADLRDANLSGANLRGANLSGANLSKVDLTKATISSTVFAQIDLRLAKGLPSINHAGPSMIELHSIHLPQDGSALHFLRGVGVPDEWIDFYRATMMHPIQYYSCFLSYSSADEHIAQRLHADLQAHGIRCWFALHDLKPGNYIRKEIDQAIHLQDKLLLILSEHAIKSGWVDYEVELALAREIRQQREILFPIRLDNEVLQSTSHWATTLQATRHIGDFTNWTDPTTYRYIFDRLLRDLKKAET